MNTEFAKALIKAQSEIGTMPKDKKGYGYNYTDFDTIISTVKPILQKNGFAFSQIMETREGKSGILTMLIHESGETLEGWFELPSVVVGKANNAQNVGASISYIKRYALSSILGISSDEDKDGAIVDMQKEMQATVTARPVQNARPTNYRQNQNYNNNYYQQ